MHIFAPRPTAPINASTNSYIHMVLYIAIYAYICTSSHGPQKLISIGSATNSSAPVAALAREMTSYRITPAQTASRVAGTAAPCTKRKCALTRPPWGTYMREVGVRKGLDTHV